jgi:hypothetical protein
MGTYWQNQHRQEGSARMQRIPGLEQHAAAARLISAMTVAVGSLYLGTHSVLVTLIGTGAASLLACWTLWLDNTGSRRSPLRCRGIGRRLLDLHTVEDALASVREVFPDEEVPERLRLLLEDISSDKG